LRLTNAKHIYLTNDGSTDRTEEIAKSMGINVFTNPRNIGKTLSLQKAISEGELLTRYKAVMFVDADTDVDKYFLKNALPYLNKSPVAAVAGQVMTVLIDNPFVTYRSYYYFTWQQIWKKISNWFNGVIIAPGTASIYKTKYLRYLSLDPLILIEDFDLTFQLHRQKFGRLVYVPEAKVFTHDPHTIKGYHKQLIRWNLGLLQTMVKHKVPSRGQSFEILLMYFFVQNWVHIFLLLSLPIYATLWFYIWLVSPVGGYRLNLWEIYLHQYLFFDFGVTILLSSWYFIHRGYYWAFKYLPFFWVVQYVHTSALLIASYKLFTAPRTSAWQSPARWKIQKS
jgi:cellulose synthase/poly-beta-1,6-N-acetylglucosamine synthase-like glycosyltransferase